MLVFPLDMCRCQEGLGRKDGGHHINVERVWAENNTYEV